MYDTDERRVSSPRLTWVITREDPYLWEFHVLREGERGCSQALASHSTCVLWRPKKEKVCQGQKGEGTDGFCEYWQTDLIGSFNLVEGSGGTVLR
jgi:hypothetical protein